MAEELQPIVIKRITAGHGHHGGSWKVAFADFAMAMMAFFLIMWLMGATTADQKGGISQYFKNPSAVQGASPLPSPSAVQGPGGPSSGMIDMGGSTEMYQNPDQPTIETDAPQDKRDLADDAGSGAGEEDKKRLEALMVDLKDAVQQREALKPFADQLLMDLTAEGLRIQVVDKESRSMFALGSPTLETFSTAMLQELAAIISTVPNRISISGHTDGRPYNRFKYGNWELSADRANAARRALIDGGMPDDKIGRVVGLSSFAPLDPVHVENPINRRISIIVMNQRTEDAIRQESGALFSVQTNLEPAAPGQPPAQSPTLAPAIAPTP